MEALPAEAAGAGVPRQVRVALRAIASTMDNAARAPHQTTPTVDMDIPLAATGVAHMSATAAVRRAVFDSESLKRKSPTHHP